MIARLLISPNLQQRINEVNKILKDAQLSCPHPDLLYFPDDSKLGIEQARKIKEHFSLKPYSAKGRAVVLEDASRLTIEAQNALLKTLEEPPLNAILILGAPSDSKFLPTILSRCQIIRLKNPTSHHTPTHSSLSLRAHPSESKTSEVGFEKILSSTIEQRFEYVEKLKEKGEFLHFLVSYFHKKPNYHSFLKELLKAEERAAQNINIRAILEYLMLVMPQKL